MQTMWRVAPVMANIDAQSGTHRRSQVDIPVDNNDDDDAFDLTDFDYDSDEDAVMPAADSSSWASVSPTPPSPLTPQIHTDVSVYVFFFHFCDFFIFYFCMKLIFQPFYLEKFKNRSNKFPLPKKCCIVSLVHCFYRIDFMLVNYMYVADGNRKIMLFFRLLKKHFKTTHRF